MPRPGGRTDGGTRRANDHRPPDRPELRRSDRSRSHRAVDLRAIRTEESGSGLISFDPGFQNTAPCRSAIGFVDGERGVLRYRGYAIEELAEKSTFLETAYLIVKGELPNAEHLAAWTRNIRIHTMVHENVKKLMEGFRYDASPMGMLVGTVGALSTFYPDARNVNDLESRRLQTRRLIGKLPTIAAYAYRHGRGLPYVGPDDELDYSGNFLSMLFRTTEKRHRPHPTIQRAVDVLFILQAEHEQNCSTNAVRCVASAQADPYSAIAAGIAALHGPRHGGANEAVIRMLAEIGSPAGIPAFLKSVKARERRLMGFGHRIYRTYDPRALLIRKLAYEVFEVTGRSPLLDVALGLERIALEDEYFASRRLYPNLDFYSGLVYQAIGLPAAMFPVLFAIARTAGWLAHWAELVDDSEQKIARPKQIYVGAGLRSYTALADRPPSAMRESPVATEI